VLQVAADAVDVADAVAVAVGETPRIHLVDDRATPPRTSVYCGHTHLLSGFPGGMEVLD
jgi:hypothetical protein